MNKYAVYHSTEVPFAYAKDKNTLTLRVRCAKDDITNIEVFYKDKYFEQKPYEMKEMKKIASTELFDYFQVDVSVFRNRYCYYFKMKDNKGLIYYLNSRGIKEKLNTMYSYIYPYIASEDVYEDVKWVQKSIVYQIFPERFCNGDKSNDPEWVLPWGEKPSYTSMFGGDLQGIINKLDYLEELGVNLLYLTPIFKSNSTHKYNTTDYFDIDPQFGTVEKAKELVRKCHEKGMKIVFDAVFNHSGDEFFAFKDLIEKGEHSQYKDWFFPDNYPVSIKECNYYTFGDNHRAMPKLNTNCEEVTQYLLNVGEYWVKEVGIDGWRLDVCDEISHEFWRKFRNRIKSINKNALIIGEIMHEAKSFLKGDQLDTIMNYPFKDGITDFFGSKTINVEEFSSILSENRMLYMDAVSKQMWNLIDSHDTKRFLTECHDNVEAMKLALVFQFTYLGVPYIYYGDEIGMNGGIDPENRRCMIWNKEQQDLNLFEYYKKLISIRKESNVLIYGDYNEIYCNDNVIAFERKYQGEKIIVIINNNQESKTIELNNSIKGFDLLEDVQVFIERNFEMCGMSAKIIKVI